VNEPSWLTLGDVLDEHVRARPAEVAAVCGEVRLTWAELADRVDRLAAVLAERGVGSGERVLWLGQNCHRLLELILAAGRLGAACCPANWRQSEDELAFVIDDCEPVVVVWQESEIGERVRAARRSAGAAGHAVWIRHDDTAPDSYEALLADAKSDPGPAEAVDADSPVLMLYTAAFAGRPNGALLPHRALVAQNVVGLLLGLAGPGDVYLNSGPLFHTGTLKQTLATFHAGGRNVFTPRVDPEELCRLVSEERCTGAFLQPPTKKAMAEAEADGRYDLSSLRPRSGPRSGYGQTELAGVVTYLDPRQPCTGSAGRPSPLARVEVMGPEGDLLPAGEVGELVVRGPMVMTGYHRRAELTAERSRGGWHHTGDLGRREADGSLSFVGPLTRIIKSAAENIYPAEVEACLRAHPAVADVAVIGVPDPTWQQSVKAIVVVADGQTVATETLVEHCRSRIASYKKPKLVAFADSLPRKGGVIDYDAVDAAYGGGGYPGSGH
jgi:long-chain acyl-CoA synthetase